MNEWKSSSCHDVGGDSNNNLIEEAITMHKKSVAAEAGFCGCQRKLGHVLLLLQE